MPGGKSMDFIETRTEISVERRHDKHQRTSDEANPTHSSTIVQRSEQ